MFGPSVFKGETERGFSGAESAGVP